MTSQLDVAGGRDIVARWCNLAEQRLEYLIELFETGRWRRFHSEQAFLENIKEAKAAVKTWRDLSSRGALFDRRAADFSWRRLRIDLSPAEILRGLGLARRPQEAEFSPPAPHRHSIVPEDGAGEANEALSEQAADEDAMKLVPDLTSIAERHPLLHNVS